MIRSIFAWIIHLAFVLLIIKIIEWAMKKSDFVKNCIYGLGVKNQF